MMRYKMPSPKNYSFQQHSNCSREITRMLEDHRNWLDPIIATPWFCQGIVWVPARFDDDGTKWVCVIDV